MASKGIFLIAQRCCRKAKLKIWCRADEATVTADVHATLTACGIHDLSLRPASTPTETILTSHFRPGAVALETIAERLTALGYEAF